MSNLLALVLVLGTAAANAQPACALAGDTLAGAARVIDGDTFAIGGDVVRLADVDAPELAQSCEGGPSALRQCGTYVADALAERIGGREVRCTILELDQYDRRIANCEVAGQDLSGWLVSSGLAMAFREYSERFMPDEDAARGSACRSLANGLPAALGVPGTTLGGRDAGRTRRMPNQGQHQP